MAGRLIYADLVVLDELGYLPFSSSGGALLFHLLSALYEKTSVIITTNPQCSVKKSAAALYPACDVDAGLPFVHWPRCNPLTSASSPRADF